MSFCLSSGVNCGHPRTLPRAVIRSDPHCFLLASDDRHAGIKNDEQQDEAAHKYPEGHTYQRVPQPVGPHDARDAYRTVTIAIISPIQARTYRCVDGPRRGCSPDPPPRAAPGASQAAHHSQLDFCGEAAEDGRNRRTSRGPTRIENRPSVMGRTFGRYVVG